MLAKVRNQNRGVYQAFAKSCGNQLNGKQTRHIGCKFHRTCCARGLALHRLGRSDGQAAGQFLKYEFDRTNCHPITAFVPPLPVPTDTPKRSGYEPVKL